MAGAWCCFGTVYLPRPEKGKISCNERDSPGEDNLEVEKYAQLTHAKYDSHFGKLGFM